MKRYFPQKAVVFMPEERRQIVQGEFVADFFVDTQISPHVYHYIVTKGTAEIVSRGEALSMEIAMEEALERMRALERRCA